MFNKVNAEMVEETNEKKFINPTELEKVKSDIKLNGQSIVATQEDVVKAYDKAEEALQRGIDVKKEMVDAFNSTVESESIESEAPWETVINTIKKFLSENDGADEQELKRGMYFIFLKAMGMLKGEGTPLDDLYGSVDIGNYEGEWSRFLTSKSWQIDREHSEESIQESFFELFADEEVGAVPSTEEELKEKNIYDILFDVMKIMYYVEIKNKHEVITKYQEVEKNFTPEDRQFVYDLYKDGTLPNLNNPFGVSSVGISLDITNLLGIMTSRESSSVIEVEGVYRDGDNFKMFGTNGEWYSEYLYIGEDKFPDDWKFAVYAPEKKYYEPTASYTVILNTHMTGFDVPVVLYVVIWGGDGKVTHGRVYEADDRVIKKGRIPATGVRGSAVTSTKLYIF